MQILLVAINAKYIHSNPAVHSLKACAGEYASYVSICEFTINQPPTFILQEIYRQRPDVIAFSCYIWNRAVIGPIISDLHKILPDTDIWAGGPEVTYDAHSALLEWNLRGVMTGPGEATFARLCAAYVNGSADKLPEVLNGITAKRTPLNEIPFWYEFEADEDNRIVYYESSRGCPFSCSYCLSSIDKEMDFKNTDHVCKDLDFFLRRKPKQVKFIDRTFNCKKSHALPILSHILAHDNGVTNFHFEISADLLDEDYFTILKQMRPGAVQLEIGVQSTCAKTLAEIRRQTDLDKIKDAVTRICSWKNIHVHLDLIAGLPFENLQTFQNSFNDVYALSPEQLQLGFLKVLKGSRMESLAKTYGLSYSSTPPYEALSTNWLSFEDICELKQVEEMVETYYNSGQFAKSLAFLLRYFQTPYEMFKSLASWHKTHKLFGVQPSRIRKYEILFEFGAAHMTRTANALTKPAYQNTNLRQDADLSIEAWKECLTYDLYLREHMKNRPPFARSARHWSDAMRDLFYEESKSHARFPQLAHCNYRELTKALHMEAFTQVFPKPAIVIFYYGKRDPLTNNCITTLEELCI